MLLVYRRLKAIDFNDCNTLYKVAYKIQQKLGKHIVCREDFYVDVKAKKGYISFVLGKRVIGINYDIAEMDIEDDYASRIKNIKIKVI